MKRVLSKIDHYWFGHGSPVSLAVMRIFVGIIGFLNLILLLPFFADWFTEYGFTPRSANLRYFPRSPMQFDFLGLHFGTQGNIPRFDPLSLTGNASVVLIVYLIITIAALTTALGLWTRLSTIVFAVGLTALHHRNMLILHGGDNVLRLYAIYLAVAPCGMALSLDRRRQLKKNPEAEIPRVSLWSQRLVCYQLALIYVTTVGIKIQGSKWLNGTATWYTMHLEEFYRFPVPKFLTMSPFMQLFTYGTLVTELALGTLVFWKPARKWVLLGGLMMHGFIEYSMNIPLFAFTICSGYVCFYDGDEVAAWLKRMKEKWFRRQAQPVSPTGATETVAPPQ